jgi:hypothetical protein
LNRAYQIVAESDYEWQFAVPDCRRGGKFVLRERLSRGELDIEYQRISEGIFRSRFAEREIARRLVAKDDSTVCVEQDDTFGYVFEHGPESRLFGLGFSDGCLLARQEVDRLLVQSLLVRNIHDDATDTQDLPALSTDRIVTHQPVPLFGDWRRHLAR